jgi:predicted AAA+ superfamily ATPase
MATEVKAAIEGKRNMEKASFMLQDNLAKNIREKVSNASIMDFM